MKDRQKKKRQHKKRNKSFRKRKKWNGYTFRWSEDRIKKKASICNYMDV
jgi:hypothetical protein